jgi:hypothetical protein
MVFKIKIKLAKLIQNNLIKMTFGLSENSGFGSNPPPPSFVL